jgi:hypothetical protein
LASDLIFGIAEAEPRGYRLRIQKPGYDSGFNSNARSVAVDVRAPGANSEMNLQGTAS